jgi:hypothetical protein
VAVQGLTLALFRRSQLKSYCLLIRRRASAMTVHTHAGARWL